MDKLRQVRLPAAADLYWASFDYAPKGFAARKSLIGKKTCGKTRHNMHRMDSQHKSNA